VAKQKTTPKTPPTPEQVERYKFLKQQEWERVRELAKKDLWLFINMVLWPREAHKHYQESLHRPITEWVDSTQAGGRRCLLIPRKHRKTYLATIAHIVWRIIRDPNVRILLVSGLDATAKRFLGVIKRQFQYNESLRHYFPEFAVDPTKQLGDSYAFVHPQRTDYNLVDPTVCATYLGAPLAGRRCDILIFDDPIEKKHVTTPEQADKALHNFNDLIPVVDENDVYNMIFVIGTRWSFNDVYAAILGEDRGDEQVVDLDSDDVYDCIVRHCFENEDGEPDFDNGKPIFDQVFSREALLKILAEYRKDPKQGEEDFWKQMMNICQSPKGRKFEADWFDTWVDRMPPNVVWSGIIIDSATKDEQVIMRGDFTVVLVGSFDAWGNLYLSDGLRSDSMKSPDLMNQTLSYAQKYGIFNIVKEKVGEEMFFGMVKEKFHSQRAPITTYPLSLRGQGRKVVRIVEALQSPSMGRKIYFTKTFPKDLHRILVGELIHIGQWSHDDVADALSCFFHKDVRITPDLHSPVQWQVRNTRTPQQSTATYNPAAMSSWKTRQPGQQSSYESDRNGDPFQVQVGDVRPLEDILTNRQK
jgi:hypothetical protein